jgi:hypothetical protein
MPGIFKRSQLVALKSVLVAGNPVNDNGNQRNADQQRRIARPNGFLLLLH